MAFLKNLSEAVERFLDSQRPAIREAVQLISQPSTLQLTSPPVALSEQDLPVPVSEQRTDRQPAEQPISTGKRYTLYQRTKELQQQGHSIRVIATRLGSSRNTVKKYCKQTHFVPKPRRKQSDLITCTLFTAALQGGETCVKTLFEEVKTQGYTGGYTILTTFLAPYPRSITAPTLPPAKKELRYTSRQLSRLLIQPEVDWPETDRPFLEHLLRRNKSISQVHRLSLQFKQLMETKQAHELACWCADAEKLPILSGFVRGIRQDFAAVEAAFRSEWSKGQTEGAGKPPEDHQVNDVWQSKVYLLRLRVLARNWTIPPK